MDNRECKAVRAQQRKKSFPNGLIHRFLTDQRGELLVEALVSFVILLIILAGITTIVMTSTNMNKKADIKTQDLEKAISEIETTGGSHTGTSGKLLITFPDQTIGIDVTVKEQDSITFFSPAAGGSK